MAIDEAPTAPLRLKVMDDGALQLRGDLSQIRVVDGDGQPFDFGERHGTAVPLRPVAEQAILR